MGGGAVIELPISMQCVKSKRYYSRYNVFQRFNIPHYYQFSMGDSLVVTVGSWDSLSLPPSLFDESVTSTHTIYTARLEQAESKSLYLERGYKGHVTESEHDEENLSYIIRVKAYKESLFSTAEEIFESIKFGKFYKKQYPIPVCDSVETVSLD
jgi:hypothetical protein